MVVDVVITITLVATEHMSLGDKRRMFSIKFEILIQDKNILVM